MTSSTLGDQHTLCTGNNKTGAKTGFAQLDLDVAPWQGSKGKMDSAVGHVVKEIDDINYFDVAYD